MSEKIPYRGSRCGLCYWALYDGQWCQNRGCKNWGKTLRKNKVRLSNDEAQILIQAKERGELAGASARRFPEAYAK